MYMNNKYDITVIDNISKHTNNLNNLYSNTVLIHKYSKSNILFKKRIRRYIDRKLFGISIIIK
jgi:hypothetical protein